MIDLFFFSSINNQLDDNTGKLDDWQREADDVNEWIVKSKTEIKSFNVPPVNEAEKEKQKKFLEVGQKIFNLFSVYGICLWLHTR